MPLTTKKSKRMPASAHHEKRRSGKHHKHNDRYLDTYWPYLPIAAIVTLGVVCSSFLGHMHKDVLGYATDMSVTSLLQDTNAQRSSNGMGNLTINAQLANAAQAKANDMVARNYWSHTTPSGDTPWAFFTAAGYNYQTAGENLAYGFDSSSAAITAWMNSPEHRANILNNTYIEVGFGVANSPDYQGTGPETIVVAEYGSPQPGAAAASPAIAASTPPSAQPADVPSPAVDNQQAAPAVKPLETNTVNTTAPSKPTVIASKNVARVQLLSGSTASWSTFAISAIAVISVFIFFLKHGLLWHRYLVKGEAFVMRHKLLDIGLVAIAVIGFVLSRSAGLIY